MFEGIRSARANGMPKGQPPNFTPNQGQGKKVPMGNPPKGKPGGGPGSHGGSGGPGGPGGHGGPGGPGSNGGPGGPTVKAVDPGAIFPCMYRYVYIWPVGGRGFWAYITYVGPQSIAGWRFRKGRWEYFGMDLRRVDEFYCS